MSLKKTIMLSLTGLLICSLTSCFRPPHNHFQHYPFTLYTGCCGKVTSSILRRNDRLALIKELQNQDIQFVQYGDTKTLIVPTDKYFRFNSAQINDICYPGLFNIVKLIKLYPKSTIYIAGFTDNIGSEKHKKTLSQARAEAMLTYLWAHNIPAQCLNAEGYGDKHAISNNKIIHGSAQNRRLEIQWFQDRLAQVAPPPYVGLTK
ncbi:OmpA family protein [Legionella israelensis]|uniref:OmpA family protein n=1 Tax=Legionella israelensis TaxID=454 RepID=A0A0W0W5K1_9GAMM|nr:OmpA family protein [Legionella israelensis]KTD27522.1 outer membrane protein, OmpA family protein [Legionella israelensis]QBR84608.1 OmpA family protein [Legionella israelensis]QBS10586.1 OmpA family protein [Legionella israelensis]QDP72271.1 OmpA family protein [Legionella israelensis]SCY36317.1 Outer membrane protein OmpA [Legionella israelensis DSM 19235]